MEVKEAIVHDKRMCNTFNQDFLRHDGLSTEMKNNIRSVIKFLSVFSTVLFLGKSLSHKNFQLFIG